MQITGAWLNAAPTQAVLRMLESEGFQALLVGGCVRNALMGIPVTDVDIATDARPESVIRQAEAVGLRAVPTGLAHGTVTVVAESQGFEVTTFRRDIETFGRHATVAFSQDLAEDAARRDFTINALYARSDGTVLDPLGGLTDLAARRIRFVGDPDARIREDYLRILRFFRFHAQYGKQASGIDPEGLAACAAGADGIARLSAERIGAEMRKLLCVPDPAPTVASMAQSGVLRRVLPGSDARALAVLVHLEEDVPADWLRRLVVLGGDVTNLRLKRSEARALDKLHAAIGTMQPASELGYRLGYDLGVSAVLARAALLETPLNMGWRNDVQRGSTARFPLRAADLPHLQGATLGAELLRLENRWIASDFTLGKAALLR